MSDAEDFEAIKRRLQARLDEIVMRSVAPPLFLPHDGALAYQPPPRNLELERFISFLEEEEERLRLFRPVPMPENLVRAMREHAELRRRARDRQAEADRKWLDSPDPVGLLFEEE